jgi:hypothetical protein
MITRIRASARMTKRWLVGSTAALAALVSLALVQGQGDQAATEAVPAPAVSTGQPIAFPHDIHAGQDQIPCMYCHFSAERSVDAGIPPVGTCIGCHQVVGGTTPAQQKEIQKVRDYFNAGEAIPWVRIYKLSDHAHFPHMRHIAAEIDCAECHGVVEEMRVIEEVAQPLAMGWCVSCHIENEVSRDCSVCHY